MKFFKILFISFFDVQKEIKIFNVLRNFCDIQDYIIL